jgi:hypothetical protein
LLSKRLNVCLGFALFFMSGCAPPMAQRQLTSETLDALRSDGTLHIVRAIGTRLAVRSPASSVVNAIPIVGVVSAISDDLRSAAWVKDYDIEDPAWSVKQLLASAIRARFGLAVRNVDIVVNSPSSEALRGALGTGHALVLWTERWMLAKGTGWAAEVSLSYLVPARLVRLSDGHVLWSGVCDVRTASAPMDKWQEENGALLKSEHVRAADACTAQLMGQLAERST